jgi:hypothetical protein
VFNYRSSGYTTDPITSVVPLGVLGVSLEWRFLAPFYAELGADYIHLFSRDNPQPGFFRPFFERWLADVAQGKTAILNSKMNHGQTQTNTDKIYI